MANNGIGRIGGSSNNIELYIDVMVLAIVIGMIAWRKFNLGNLISRSEPLPDSQDYSAIIAFYTTSHLLAMAGRGKLDGMDFTTYMTSPGSVLNSTNQGGGISYTDDMAVIHVLDLPFNTDTHLIGLSKQHKIDRIKFDNFLQSNGMEKVVLEGDFSDYFDLYAAKGEQVNVRQVLAPDAMAYVVDFCRGHFWEINRANLYFVASTSDSAQGDIFQEAQNFVARIKPALEPGDPGAPVVHHAVPYGEYEGPPLNCPICGKQMTSNNIWHTCPGGHGILATGRELEALHDHAITIAADPAKTIQHQNLTCPNSHAPMEPINYEETSIKIDVCTNCPYRWLDADDIVKLSSSRPVI